MSGPGTASTTPQRIIAQSDRRLEDQHHDVSVQLTLLCTFKYAGWHRFSELRKGGFLAHRSPTRSAVRLRLGQGLIAENSHNDYLVTNAEFMRAKISRWREISHVGGKPIDLPAAVGENDRQNCYVCRYALDVGMKYPIFRLDSGSTTPPSASLKRMAIFS